ncbi:hypothetical protein ES703_93745 [subsurface metagenome]
MEMEKGKPATNLPPCDKTVSYTGERSATPKKLIPRLCAISASCLFNFILIPFACIFVNLLPVSHMDVPPASLLLFLYCLL